MSRIAHNFNAPAQDYSALELEALANMPGKQTVVLLVIDGLGYQYLNSLSGFLREYNCTSLTSVLPSTTASSISTFLTGHAPQQHGMTGWFVYLEEIGEVTAVLPFQPRGSMESLSERGIDINKLYNHRVFFDLLDVPSYIVSPRWILGTEFSRSHCGGATAVAYDDLDGMISSIVELATRPDKKYVYAYWAEFDHLSHEHGNKSDEVAAHFQLLEQALEKATKELRGSNCLLLITADHGFIDTSPERMITVNDHPSLQECLRLPLCGEPRLAYCYVHPDKHEQFVDYVKREFAEQLECIESYRLIERGVFGKGQVHPRLMSRVGDYALIMKDNYVIKDWLPSEKRFFHYGVHGGISENEIYVPLIVIEP